MSEIKYEIVTWDLTGFRESLAFGVSRSRMGQGRFRNQ